MNTTLFSPTVSMVANAFANETTDINAHAAIDDIRSAKYQRKINLIRKRYVAERDPTQAKRAIDPLKKNLPAYQWCGQFDGRGDKQIKKYSGLLCADYDNIDPGRLTAARAGLIKDPHVWGLFASPSGAGLKAVYRVAGGLELHEGNFEAVKKHSAEKHGLAVDEACKNVERLCYVSHDPCAFYNNRAVPLEPIVATTVAKSASTNGIHVQQGRRQIAEQLLGPIEWTADDEGSCRCPGAGLHTGSNGVRDCKVWVGTGSAPSISCFHNSCRGIVDGVNHELRSRIGKAEAKGQADMNSCPPASQASDADKLTEWDYANKLEAVLPPTKTCGSQWFSYSGGAWQEIDRATLRPKAQAVLPPIIRTARRESAIIEHLEGRYQVSADLLGGFYKFADGDILINANNGVVKVSQGISFEPPNPDHLFTKKLAANFISDAQAPLFNRALGEALPDEHDRILLQLCAGNFLLPDSRFEIALVPYGEAGRGKSTVAETIAEVLGKSLVKRLTLAQLCDPRSYHVPQLRYAAVNLSTELDAV
jgi:hypothetical protein